MFEAEHHITLKNPDNRLL